VALSLFAGGAIGAIAVEGLHAQATPPIYIVAEIDVSNLDTTSAGSAKARSSSYAHA
jgi:hypothetical protein